MSAFHLHLHWLIWFKNWNSLSLRSHASFFFGHPLLGNTGATKYLALHSANLTLHFPSSPSRSVLHIATKGIFLIPIVQLYYTGLSYVGPLICGFFSINILKFFWDYLTTVKQVYWLYEVTIKQWYCWFFVINAWIIISLNTYEFLFHIIFIFLCLVAVICMLCTVFCII